MNHAIEFDTEFCNVKYIEKDNVVLLTWKQFAQSEDYRRPTLFALDLLRRYPKCNLVVDARNGFEDAKEDVEWGFSELLPNMAAMDCSLVAFILQNAPEIEAEMDMWTIEFGKYFAVTRSESYEQAIHSMNNLILVNVKYRILPGKRNEFLEKAERSGIIRGSKTEPGNYRYEYYLPAVSEDELFLMEIWTNDAAIQMHMETEHYQKLQALKKEFVTDVSFEKFNICHRHP